MNENDKMPLAIKIKTDIGTVRRALAIITKKGYSDQEIKEKFFDRDDLMLDLDDPRGTMKEADKLQVVLMFVAMMMGQEKVNQEAQGADVNVSGE